MANPANGIIAGLVGTVPMTAFMEAAHQALPEHEQYPLPPEEVMLSLEHKTLQQHPDDPAHMAMTWAGHFGYGGAVGTVYAALADSLPFSPAVNGALFGLGVWAASYLGILPALHILTPATEHPARRKRGDDPVPSDLGHSDGAGSR
jgi:hypothetical protein